MTLQLVAQLNTNGIFSSELAFDVLHTGKRGRGNSEKDIQRSIEFYCMIQGNKKFLRLF